MGSREFRGQPCALYENDMQNNGGVIRAIFLIVKVGILCKESAPLAERLEAASSIPTMVC